MIKFFKIQKISFFGHFWYLVQNWINKNFLGKMELRQFLALVKSYIHAKNKKTNQPILRKSLSRQTENGQTGDFIEP